MTEQLQLDLEPADLSDLDVDNAAAVLAAVEASRRPPVCRCVPYPLVFAPLPGDDATCLKCGRRW